MQYVGHETQAAVASHPWAPSQDTGKSLEGGGERWPKVRQDQTPGTHQTPHGTHQKPRLHRQTQHRHPTRDTPVRNSFLKARRGHRPKDHR